MKGSMAEPQKGGKHEIDFKSRTLESERPPAGSADGGNTQEDRGRRSGDTEGLRGTREYPAGPRAAAPHKSELTIAEPDFSVSCGFSASRGFCFSLFCSWAWAWAWVKRSRKARARFEGAF